MEGGTKVHVGLAESDPPNGSEAVSLSDYMALVARHAAGSPAETLSLQFDVEHVSDVSVAAVSHGRTEAQFKDLVLDLL